MAAPIAPPPTVPRTAPDTNRYLLDREKFLGPIMLLPAVIYIVALVGVPLVIAIAYAFSDVTVGDQSIDWVGLKNFRNSWGNAAFQKALKNSLIFTFVTQALVMILGNILALVLASDFKGKRLVRFLILLPWATPVALVAVGWWWIFSPPYSALDYILREIGALGPGGWWSNDNNAYWLALPDRAQFSVVLVQVWRVLPLATVILLAGLTAIPQDVREAANLDGAGYMRQLVWIRLPLLAPIMLVAFLFGTVFVFSDMIIVYIMTRGQPNDATQVIPHLAFMRGVQSGDLASGASVAVFLFPVLAGVAALMLRTARRAETS
ncbi:MAG: sugar ABC transporter permease [Thermomicrobiales bacterium]|nr:sugar ABC transporter permease [Thermomicrobiales bacterium]